MKHVRKAFALRLFPAITIYLAVFVLSPSCHQRAEQPIQQRVTVVSWGGLLQEDLVGKWMTPAAKRANVAIDAQTWPGDMAALATRIRRSVNTWDLVHVELQDAHRSDRKELFEAFPQRTAKDLEPALRKQKIVAEGIALPVMEWGYVLAYRLDALHLPPTTVLTWSDFWNTKRYPGHRGIRNTPIGAIEIALFSLGRDPRAVLYDEHVTRQQIERQLNDALDRLDQLAAQTTWWETGDQIQRGLSSGDFVMAAAYTGRTGSAFREICPGAMKPTDPCSLASNPATAIIGTDWWVIPKGAEHAAAASALLDAMYSDSSAEQGARLFSAARGYRVPISSLRVTDPIMDHFLLMGSSVNTQALRIDERFWSANFSWINERWRLWRSRH